MSAVTTRTIGDRHVGAIGLGTARMSLADERDDSRSIRAIRDAIDAGVTLIDTAHAYTTREEPTHAERLVHEAVAGHPVRDQVLIATKGGHWREGSGFPIDGRPEVLRRHLEASLRALGVDVIDLYQLHHPDPTVPIEESVGALAEFRAEGLVRMIGVSNVTRELYERAAAVAPIAAVQNQLSPFRTDDVDFLSLLAQRDVAYLSHSPFGGSAHVGDLGGALPATSRVADQLGVTVQQVILAWQLGLSPVLIPIVGSTHSSSILDSAAAVGIVLDSEARRCIGAEVGQLQTGGIRA